MAALPTLGREWIAHQLRQLTSVASAANAEEAARGALDPVRVTAGELLGSMTDVVPLLPPRIPGQCAQHTHPPCLPMREDADGVLRPPANGDEAVDEATQKCSLGAAARCSCTLARC